MHKNKKVVDIYAKSGMITKDSIMNDKLSRNMHVEGDCHD